MIDWCSAPHRSTHWLTRALLQLLIDLCFALIIDGLVTSAQLLCWSTGALLVDCMVLCSSCWWTSALLLTRALVHRLMLYSTCWSNSALLADRLVLGSTPEHVLIDWWSACWLTSALLLTAVTVDRLVRRYSPDDGLEQLMVRLGDCHYGYARTQILLIARAVEKGNKMAYCVGSVISPISIL